MTEQSAKEAVDALLSLAFANPDGVAEAMSRAIDMMEARESLIALIEASEARAEKAEAGLKAVQELIENSLGVVGLHLNGDDAPWESLLEGGYFKEWLRDFSVALAELEARHA